jgi:two-component system alkaline phosphatase synthesis response regulator PhoP
VSVAGSLRQASSRIRSARPDVLVLDVASFGSYGYKISETLRVRLDGVPTILLLKKGHASAGSVADAFMTPPFTSRKLLYRVRKVADQLISRELRAGSLVFDPDTRTVRKGNTSVPLRPKEAALLAMFMHNPGRVLSRQELMKEVWETDYMGDTRTLSVHVRWLRTKIEDDPNSPRFLRTVRGVGYRFEVPDEEET